MNEDNTTKELKPIIYFCDNCETSKNSSVDGKPYNIKISIRPKVLSAICPACQPNVVRIEDDG